MKKHYLIALLAFVFQFANAQLDPVAYRGAFAPSPAAMWTDSWTNWNPNAEAYTDPTTAGSVVGDSFNLVSDGSKYYLRGNVTNFNAVKFA